MPEFFDRIFFDNTLRSYFIVAGTILFAWVLKRFVGTFVSNAIFWILRQFGKGINREAFRTLVLGPFEKFLFLLISITAISNLNFPKALYFEFLHTNTQKFFNAIAAIILILAFFRMLLRIVDYMARIMERKASLTPDPNDNQLVVFFKDFLKAVLVIIGLLSLIRYAFNYDISKILAGLGIAGAAIALAAKESIENLIASFIIFFDKPFTTGDLLKVHNITGTVEKIGLRSTRIRTTEKTFVTVPNKQMVDSIVDNLTLRTQRRGELRLELGLMTTTEKIESFLQSAKSILTKHKIDQKTVLLGEITQQAFLVNIEYFTPAFSIQEFNEVKQNINLDIVRLLENMGIEISGASHDIKIFRQEVASRATENV